MVDSGGSVHEARDLVATLPGQSGHGLDPGEVCIKWSVGEKVHIHIEWSAYEQAMKVRRVCT